MSTVVALGGNALIRAGERGTAAEQLANLRRAVAALQPLLSEPGLVITHGNGPQVGNELLRQEREEALARSREFERKCPPLRPPDWRPEE